MAKKADDEAKWAVLHEFDVWAMNNPEDAKGAMTGMMFFAHLQQERPELLRFEYPGDKWQRIHGWLLEGRRVKD